MLLLRLLLAALLLLEASKDGACSPVPEVEPDRIRSLLNYMKTNPETLGELLDRKHVVSEGDMVLPADRNAVERIWPTRDIAYVIDPELADRTHDIAVAMAMVSEHTCVTFHNRTTESDFLVFTGGRGCASYVGFIGGEQPVFVGPHCIVGNIVHEVLHALGFHHEHTRTDRENFITIMTHNIMDGKQGNFLKREGQTFNLKYDVSSIMHYGSRFFSDNGLPTIIPKADVDDMGQREKMTELDVERVRKLYSCGAPWKVSPNKYGSEENEDSYVHLAVDHDQDQQHLNAPPAEGSRTPKTKTSST